MNKRFSACLLAVTLLATLSAGRAHAVVFRPTELSSCPVTGEGDVSCIGAEITVGFRVETIPGEFVRELAASAYGWDGNVVEFVAGQAVTGLFYWDAFQATNVDTELDNALLPQSPNDGMSPGSGPLSESESGPLGGRVAFFRGSPRIGGSTSSSSRGDYGLDGVFNRTDSQFRITFRLLRSGTSIVRFGSDHPGDGVVFSYEGEWKPRPVSGFSLVLSSDAQPYVIPEPATAIFMGFGLMVLSARREGRLRGPK